MDVLPSFWFLQAENPSGMNEENEVIMAILRGIYERRQLQHTHIGQVTDNPHFINCTFNLYMQGKDCYLNVLACSLFIFILVLKLLVYHIEPFCTCSPNFL